MIFPAFLPLLVGGILLFVSLFMLIRSGGFGALIRSIFPLMLLLLSLSLILGGLDILSYRQLLKESSIATIRFEKNSPQTFTAILITDDQKKHYFQLKGDQWQIDARIIRWHPNLARMGFKTIYRMDRISGRYQSIQQELHAERTVHPVVLSDPSGISSSGYGIDLWAQLQQIPWLHRWVDATYGSATYVPMVDGAVFDVKIGYSGLSAHPINAVSRQAVKGWQ